MGRFLFRLPDIGEGVTEAEIVAWHVKPGDVVAEDQTLLDVMTDKATVDMTSPVAGVVQAVHGAVGDMAPVGSVLIEFEIAGAADETTPAAEPVAASLAAPVKQSARDTAPPPRPAISEPSPPPRSRTDDRPAAPRGAAAPLAAPATRRRAFELGVALQFVPGTGPGGRITPADLDAYLANGARPASDDPRLTRREGQGEVRIIGLRRKIAEKMQDAKRRIPHFAYVEEIDVTELEALRQALNADRRADQPKLTLLPFLMRALVRILPDFPQVNARFDDEAGVLRTFEAAHIGIATQTPGGLMVPVVRHAETLDLWESARELQRVSAAARSGAATREELSGSSITLTSLGALGGIAATPVINHPEVAIIGPNKLVDKPVVQGAFISIRKVMNLSSSFDHRIVDGYDAARFVQALKRLLEHPALIFMD